MIVIASLTYCKLIFAMSTPSTSILPPHSSIILVKASVIVLFPAPVLPTTPIFSPPLISKESYLRTSSVVGLYLSWTSVNLIAPWHGQAFSVYSGCFLFSCGILRSLKHFWTEAIFFSKSPEMWIKPLMRYPRWTTCWKAMAIMIGSAPLNLLKRQRVPVRRVEAHEANISLVEYHEKVANDTCCASNC